MLVNGVDIAKLEGWMIKINSNPSVFGRTTGRRWFKVGFVVDQSSNKRLVISYSSSKNAKEPRGWLYVEDVSVISCRQCIFLKPGLIVQELIEIVTPSRTLRLKGETAAEHQLWSDSLYRLCNPVPKTPPASTIGTRRERSRRTQRESKHVSDEEDEDDHEQRKRSSGHQRQVDNAISDKKSQSVRSNCPRDDIDHENDNDDHTQSRSRNDSDDHDTRERVSLPSSSRHQERELLDRSSRHECKALPQQESSRRPDEHDPSDEDSSEDDQADRTRPSTTSSSRSLLVSQIKSGSAMETDLIQCKNIISDSEEEEDIDGPEDKSPRTPITSTTQSPDDDDKIDQVVPERTLAASKRLNSESFSSDEEEIKPVSPRSSKLPMASVVMSDNNFVHDDWDREEEEDQPLSLLVKKSNPAGGVTADANFVYDDWD